MRTVLRAVGWLLLTLWGAGARKLGWLVCLLSQDQFFLWSQVLL